MSGPTRSGAAFMKREVKAALGLAVLLLGGLLALVARDEGEPAPPTEATTSSRAGAPSERSAPPPHQSAPAPSAKPSLGDPSPGGLVPPLATSPPETAPASGSQSLPPTLAYLEGIVVSPAGSPVATKVYAFEVGPRVNPSYAYFGHATPIEVQALARRLSEGCANFVAETPSDAAGAFRFEQEELTGFEVLLLAAADEGVGALRVRPGSQSPVLALEARRTLRVQIRSPQDLSESRLQLDLGSAGALEFPPLDPQSATRLEVLATLPRKSRLHLQRPSWLAMTRKLSQAELSEGQVIWTLPTNLADLEGRVREPEGGPRVGAEVQLWFRDPEREGWRSLRLRTDSEGAFLGRGFPLGQRVRVSVAGTAEHAYHHEVVTAGDPPISIHLQPASVLRIRVARFEGDVDAIEAEWTLERREGEAWRALPSFLYGRTPRQFPASEGELERRFGLRVGLNEVLGLRPGRYRVSLAGFDGNVTDSVEAELRPSEATTCELGVRKRPLVTFRIQLAGPGPELGGRKVRISYREGPAEVLRTPTLDAGGRLILETRFTGPIQAEISLPALRLGAKVTLDPKTPDLGTVLLEED